MLKFEGESLFEIRIALRYAIKKARETIDETMDEYEKSILTTHIEQWDIIEKAIRHKI